MDGGLQQIDAGVDEEVEHRLLVNAGDLDAVAVDDAVGHLEIVLPHGDGDVCGVLAMEGEHGAEIDLRKDVAIDDEQRLILRLHEAERAGGAERRLLRDVAQIDAEGRAIAEVVADFLRLENAW